MSEYIAPLPEMTFLVNGLMGTKNSDSDIDKDMVEAILEEASKLASGVLSPINRLGDIESSILKDGRVITPKGFKEAYKQYCDNGWNSVPFPEKYGGQELPWLIAFPIQEMWQSANMSFGLCPLLNQGAVDAILSHGTEEQKEIYLPKLISGEWTGTMNLTEPQAGSDLAAITTKAVKQENDSYKISGQKIFITYGDHDMSENIIHLVLARTPDAPAGVKGISLFIVPKFIDGKKNDVECVSLEHKLGIHASPTCTMSFGDKGGATGYLVGKENEGLKYMFTMMNNARLSVGLQGVAIAQRAYQQAKEYACERVQGKSITGQGDKVTIENHPDVKRMLIDMRAKIMACRALTYYAASCIDIAKSGDSEALAMVGLLTPIVKSYCTDMAVDVTSTAIQVHGGMGYIEETGAAQYYRDARILPIYEGTNGIQSLDLLFRKILMDNGNNMFNYIENMKDSISECDYLTDMVHKLEIATNHIVKLGKAGDNEKIAMLASTYLEMSAIIFCSFALYQIKAEYIEEFDYYMKFILPKAKSLCEILLHS